MWSAPGFNFRSNTISFIYKWHIQIDISLNFMFCRWYYYQFLIVKYSWIISANELYNLNQWYGVPQRTVILCGLSIFYFYFSPRWECFHRGENVLTAVGMFPPRWECSHRCENVLTAVGMFLPRWKHSHRGEK